MALELTLEMNKITEALIKGELTQEEALSKQRKLLNAPEETLAPIPSPIVSTGTKIEATLAKIQSEKADISARLQTIKEKATTLNSEREKLLGAIATSEQKLNILVGSPMQYRNAKAEAIAHGLLTGDPVDLDTVSNNSVDLVDRVSATDLKAALQVLKGQMQEVERRKVGLTAETRKLSGEYYELHAKEHGILFAQKALELVDEYAAVQAAHRANLNLGGFSQLAPDSFSTLNIVSPLSDVDAREIGITRREWNGAIIETTTAIRNAQAELMNEMGV